MPTKRETAGARRKLKTPERAAPRTPKRDEPYHHGDLHQALLAAAEAVLVRDGLSGLTLRAVAREAGVSHAAPAHHFDDLSGLVSELAAVGFLRFNAAMRETGTVAGTPLEKAMARAHAYVAYARANPAMYGLMFRNERLDMMRPALREAADASFAALTGAVGATRQESIDGDTLSISQAAGIVRAWSLIHGFATLLIDGRLHPVLERMPDADVDALLDAMLQSAIGKS